MGHRRRSEFGEEDVEFSWALWDIQVSSKQLEMSLLNSGERLNLECQIWPKTTNENRNPKSYIKASYSYGLFCLIFSPIFSFIPFLIF